MPRMDRIYRFADSGSTRYAVERDGAVYALDTQISHVGQIGDIVRRDSPGAVGPAGRIGNVGGAIEGGIASLALLPPVSPAKIVCVGLNYKDHAAEQSQPLPVQPLIFIKPSTAVLGPGGTIRLPPGVGRVDHEAELGVVIGRRAHRVKRAQAWDYILGLICVNDVTARDLQKQESQYTRSKGFDTFAPIGPCIAMGLDGAPRAVEGWVNGQRRQVSSTTHLIFPIDYLVEFISFVMTLEPGDIISTGTPAGIGPLINGDTVTVKIEGVGELTNPVRAEA
jgi:2-keto-4-pentenoate hydratase/2-oxohepta-3-ene-1,7-dioic acid hydratase in catechol pathway